MLAKVNARRFPPPWLVEETDRRSSRKWLHPSQPRYADRANYEFTALLLTTGDEELPAFGYQADSGIAREGLSLNAAINPNRFNRCQRQKSGQKCEHEQTSIRVLDSEPIPRIPRANRKSVRAGRSQNLRHDKVRALRQCLFRHGEQNARHIDFVNTKVAGAADALPIAPLPVNDTRRILPADATTQAPALNEAVAEKEGSIDCSRQMRRDRSANSGFGLVHVGIAWQGAKPTKDRRRPWRRKFFGYAAPIIALAPSSSSATAFPRGGSTGGVSGQAGRSRRAGAGRRQTVLARLGPGRMGGSPS